MVTTSSSENASAVSPPTNFARLLVAVDESKASEWAVLCAAAMAHQLGAHLALVNVVESIAAGVSEISITPETREESLADSTALLVKRRLLIDPSLVPPVEIIRREGIAAKEIVKAADAWSADLILMGSHARGRIGEFLLGSVTREVIRQAHCPVTVVAHPPAAKPAGMHPER